DGMGRCGRTDLKFFVLVSCSWDRPVVNLPANFLTEGIMQFLAGIILLFAPTLATPTNLTGSGSATPTVHLTWTDTNSSESGYEVMKKWPGQQVWTVLPSLPIDAISYDDTNVANNTAYQYTVRAWKKQGSGKIYSNLASQVTVTVPAAVPP